MPFSPYLGGQGYGRKSNELKTLKADNAINSYLRAFRKHVTTLFLYYDSTEEIYMDPFVSMLSHQVRMSNIFIVACRSQKKLQGDFQKSILTEKIITCKVYSSVQITI